MKQRKLKIVRELREILTDSELSEITMTGLRDGYESRFGLGECSSSSELRKWIYRRILPLVKRGYLIKNDQSEEQAATYSVTEQFKKEFQIRRQASRPKNHANQVAEAPESQLANTLKSKLNQYQVDMLACAGECKEYQQLAVDYPHLRDQIEPMYRSARERSSELMGQLTAINNLLKHSDLME